MGSKLARRARKKREKRGALGLPVDTATIQDNIAG